MISNKEYNSFSKEKFSVDLSDTTQFKAWFPQFMQNYLLTRWGVSFGFIITLAFHSFWEYS